MKLPSQASLRLLPFALGAFALGLFISLLIGNGLTLSLVLVAVAAAGVLRFYDAQQREKGKLK